MAEDSVVAGPLLCVWLWGSPPLLSAQLQLGEFALKDEAVLNGAS